MSAGLRRVELSVGYGWWNAAFLQEHEQFPLGEHDDRCDAAGWAFFLLTGKTSAFNGRDRARAHFNPWGNPWAGEDVEP